MGWKKQVRKNKRQPTTFDLLEKRHHVQSYIKTKIPPKEYVESALWKAWKTSPSKNNAMAYKVFVYGPKHHKEKELVHQMVHKNHIKAEKSAVARGQHNITEDGRENPFYQHIKHNPYLLCIHQEPRPANKFYEDQVKQGMFYDQAFPARVDYISDSVCVEVGMFIQNLTTYLLEYDIDVSYTSCFFRDISKWRKAGLVHSNYRPSVLMTIGYKRVYRKELLKAWNRVEDDKKPEIDEIVKWM
tara:strand:+ start:1595 stop:2323 length:729 start_codon:yes stop_codon:yes gene_type:complete